MDVAMAGGGRAREKKGLLFSNEMVILGADHQHLFQEDIL